MQPKTAIGSTSNGSPEKSLAAGDIARSLLGPNSVSRISNVLVVGSQGSTPMKRMEMRFYDPKQVPVSFGLLAAALITSGFELKATPQADIPANEIWLTSPLGGAKRTLLCCAATIAGGVTPAVVIPAMHEAGHDKHATQL